MAQIPVSDSAKAPPRLPGAVTHLAIAWGVVVAIALPLLLLAVGYQAEVVRLDTALQVATRANSAAASLRRVGTASDPRAAQDLLAVLSIPGVETGIRISDAGGRVLAAAEGDLRSPSLLRAAVLFPGEAGSMRVEMSRSLRPLLLHGLLMLVPGLLLGWVAFVALKDVPMRAFRLALWEAAVRKEAEERLAKSLSVFAATLESTADAILVTDALGRAVVSNQRFAQLWNEARRDTAGDVDPDAMFAIATRLRDPGAFLETQKDLTRHIEIDHGAVLELIDGRLFEWNSRPQFIDGTVVGRVSSFRDISERKRAEALLSAEKEVLEMVVCGTPLTTALGVLARRLELLSGEMFCAIVFRESNEAPMLSLAIGPNLPRPFADAMVEKDQATLEGIFTDASALDEQGTHAGTDRHNLIVDDLHARPAWHAYHARVEPLGIAPGFTVPVRSTAGRPIGLIVAHYRPGCEPPRNDRDLIRVASHLTRIAIERRQAEAQLRFLAHYDALTFLPNRDLFRDRLMQALSQASRRGNNVAVMFLDLDRFKTINDTLGHDAGDLLLCEVSERLRRCVREEDTVARLGGDEFTVILQGIKRPDDAGMIASKIIEALALPIMLSGRETFATPSIGITVYPSDGTSAERLLKNADTAMYRAKKDGGNGYCFFDPAMNVVAEDRLELESGLRRALEREEFVVHYQPKLCLASGTIGQAEALLRWKHPERGLVAPGEFVPILEETGLIEAVGEWVLRTVCAQIRAWEDDGLAPLTVAVNLSGRQLQHNNVADTIGRILLETGVEPHLLEVEVTESMLMHDPAYAADMLDQIRAKGVEHITVDDFGTGYSSLNYLKRFPIDALKLDKSFVDGLPHDQDDVAISRAVIALGHSLKMKIIAEGVETEDQRRFLHSEGCDLVQGYVVSGALPADAITLMMRQDARAHRRTETASVLRLPVQNQPPAARGGVRARRQA